MNLAACGGGGGGWWCNPKTRQGQKQDRPRPTRQTSAFNTACTAKESGNQYFAYPPSPSSPDVRIRRPTITARSNHPSHARSSPIPPTRDLRRVCHTKAPKPTPGPPRTELLAFWKEKAPRSTTRTPRRCCSKRALLPPLHVSETDRQISLVQLGIGQRGGALVNIETKRQLFGVDGWQAVDSAS